MVRLTLAAPASNAPLLEILNSSSMVVETFTTPSSIPSGTSTITFLPSTPFTFLANTAYSLLLTSSNPLGGPFDWKGSNPAITPTTNGVTFTSATAMNGSQGPLSFQIDSAAVPEPASIVMGCAGGLTLLGFYRVRRFLASR